MLQYNIVTHDKAFLSSHQLQQRWGFHQESIRRMIREGRLPAVRFGKRLRVSLADIEAYENTNRLVQVRRT